MNQRRKSPNAEVKKRFLSSGKKISIFHDKRSFEIQSIAAKENDSYFFLEETERKKGRG